MRLAIMQPYLFPYLGYFKLVGSVDRFVFYDDVNYIKNGWINRNRLFLAGDIRHFTIPLVKQSPFKKINDIEVASTETWRSRMRESIRHSYGKAPFFRETMKIFDDATMSATISEISKRSITLVADYIGLTCDFVESSTKYENEFLSGQDRVIDICRSENASIYVNLPGGSDLYDFTSFSEHGIELRFLDGNLPEYDRGTQPRIAGLSIIDALMFQPPEVLRRLVTQGAI